MNLGLVADNVCRCHFLNTEIVLATGVELLDLDGGYSMVDTVVHHGIVLAIERQVDSLAHLAVLEQGGVALGRYFNDFVLGGVQHDLVFARLGIGTDSQRMAGNIHACRVLVASTEGSLVHSALHCFVLLLANKPGGVVALQLDDNLQRVAQVVLREAVAKRPATLDVATYYTTAQHDGSRVPKIDIRDVLDEVVLIFLILADGIVIHQESAVSKVVVVLHGLDRVRSPRNAQREGALVVGCNDLVTGIVHHVAVELEGYTWHGNRGVAVVHVT